MYVYHFQYYQISKFISLFFTLYMTNINFFIMPFILCCNLLSHILLVFVYFYSHHLISIFSIFLFFFCLFLLQKDFCNHFVLVLAVFLWYIYNIFFFFTIFWILRILCIFFLTFLSFFQSKCFLIIL